MRAYNALQFSEYGLVFARFRDQTVTLESFDEYRILTSQGQYRGRAILESALSKRGEASLYFFRLPLQSLRLPRNWLRFGVDIRQVTLYQTPLTSRTAFGSNERSLASRFRAKVFGTP